MCPRKRPGKGGMRKGDFSCEFDGDRGKRTKLTRLVQGHRPPQVPAGGAFSRWHE